MSTSKKKKISCDDEMPFELLSLGSMGDGSLKEKLRDKGIYYITGEISGGSLLEMHQDILLKHLDPKWTDEIQIIVNSVGGEVAEGWALIDLLDWVRMPIRTTAMGYCASLGAMLAACGTKGKRSITRNTAMMVHGAHLDAIGGTYQQIAATTKEMLQEYERAILFWQEHSKYGSPEQVKKIFLNGVDQSYTPEECLSHGICDNLILPPKKK